MPALIGSDKSEDILFSGSLDLNAVLVSEGFFDAEHLLVEA